MKVNEPFKYTFSTEFGFYFKIYTKIVILAKRRVAILKFINARQFVWQLQKTGSKFN